MLVVIGTIVKNASQSNLNDLAWKNDVYSKFDKLIALSNDAANVPHLLDGNLFRKI